MSRDPAGPSPMENGRASPLADSSSMTELIEIMLEELGDGPEPLQTVPEELQPMLERFQQMAEMNQTGLDPAAPLHLADPPPYPGQYQPSGQEPRPEFQPMHVLPHQQYDPQGTAPDAQYAQVFQTISAELCQIMTPGGAPHQEQCQGMSYQSSGGPAEAPAMYQPSTSYDAYHCGPLRLPHLQMQVPPAPPVPVPPPSPGQTSTPTLLELLSPQKPKTSPLPPLESPQHKGDSPSVNMSGGLTLCRRSVAEQDDPDFWLNLI